MHPADKSKSDRRQEGRDLAMDSLLQDALKSSSPTTQAAAPTAPKQPRALWLALGAAASVAAMWGLLWGTGMLESAPGGNETQREAHNQLADPMQGQGPEGTDPGVASSADRSTSHPPGETPPNPGIVAPDRPRGEGVAQGPAGRANSSLPAQGKKPQRQEIPTPDAAGQIQIPASADPEDIKLLRSAQAMLAAEAELERRIQAGHFQGVDKLLKFDEISKWPYQKGVKGMPEAVRKLDDKKVVMTGFMLPIDEVENITQFLLVKSLWSCCFGTPPDINGTVRVVMQGTKVDYAFEPIEVSGTFKISETMEDGFCLDIFQLEATGLKVIKAERGR